MELLESIDVAGTWRRVLISETGESEISCEDFAMAMIDELEVPKYLRKRFTVGY